MIKDNLIIIFGFSGSGKSTLANHLAREYDMRVIHPSSILRDLYGGKTIDLENTVENKGFWESPEGLRLFKSRLEDEKPYDLLSDRILVREVERGDVVIDSWSLPWLTKKGTKISLYASLEVRAGRVARRSSIRYEQSLDIVSLKDEETRKLFLRLYGFDIREDHHVFDYEFDTDTLDKEGVFEKAKHYLNNIT